MRYCDFSRRCAIEHCCVRCGSSYNLELSGRVLSTGTRGLLNPEERAAEVEEPYCGGRCYATAGTITLPVVELDPRTLNLNDLRFYGATMLDVLVYARLVKSIEANKLRPVVAASRRNSSF